MLDAAQCQVGSMKNKKTLSDFRRDKNLSQDQLSHRMGVSFRTISEWERGLKTPRLDNAVLLCIELSLSLKQLAEVFGINAKDVPNDEPAEPSTGKR